MPTYIKDADKLIEIVTQHVQFVMDHAIDRYGSTPLFANALDADSGEPVPYDPDHVNKQAILSSPVSQQHWLETLVKLSRLSGKAEYAEAAKAVIAYMFQHLRDSNGLLYWGGHTAYNMEKLQIEFAGDKQKVHELKCHYPNYELMWQTDAEATREYIEAMWSAHVLDWTNLDFNRHGPYNAPTSNRKCWDNEYAGGDVFFWGKGLTFVNAGSDLYYAAAMLAHLSGQAAPLEWSKRLAKRYIETRQGEIGISGYQFSQSANAWCNGPSIRGDRAQYQIAPLVPSNHLVYEGTIFKPRPAIQRRQLLIGVKLGPAGADFIRWACEEMTAWGIHAYRRKDNSFVPMLTDGWVIEGLALDRDGYFGRKGRVFGPIPATASFFWMYAMGFRLSNDPFLWQMTRNIGLGLGIGDIDNSSRNRSLSSANADPISVELVNGLLELYQATNRSDLLELAYELALRMVQQKLSSGKLKTDQYVLTDDPLPLSLLHIAECMKSS